MFSPATWRVSRCHSTGDPLHQTTWSARVGLATSRTHSRSQRWRESAYKAGMVAAVIAYLLTGAGTTGRGASRTGVRGRVRRRPPIAGARRPPGRPL